MSKNQQPQMDLNEKFYIFDNFITSNKHILERGDKEWDSSKIFFQLSIEHADNSPLTHGAEKFEEDEHVDWDYVRDVNRNEEMYISPLVNVLVGHQQDIRGGTVLDNGNIMSWDSENIFVWDKVNYEYILLSFDSQTIADVFISSKKHIVAYSSNIIKVHDGDNYETINTINSDFNILGVIEISQDRLLSWNDKNIIEIWENGNLDASFNVSNMLDREIYGIVEYGDGLICWGAEEVLHISNDSIVKIYDFRFDIQLPNANQRKVSIIDDMLLISFNIRDDDRGMVGGHELYQFKKNKLVELDSQLFVGVGNIVFKDNGVTYIQINRQSNSELFIVNSKKKTIESEHEFDNLVNKIAITDDEIYAINVSTIDIYDKQFNKQGFIKGYSGIAENIFRYNDNILFVYGSAKKIYLFDKKLMGITSIGEAISHAYIKANNDYIFIKGSMKFFYENGKYLKKEYFDSYKLYSFGEIDDDEHLIKYHTSSFNGLPYVSWKSNPLKNKLFDLDTLTRYFNSYDVKDIEILEHDTNKVLVGSDSNNPIFLKYICSKNNFVSIVKQSNIQPIGNLDEKYFSDLLHMLLSSKSIKQGLKTKFAFNFVNKLYPLEYDIDLKLGNTEIYREYALSSKKSYDKNIDLLFLNLDNDIAIGIENKFLGDDSKEQLDSYYDGLREQFSDVVSNVYLVYLTLDGRKPKNSVNEKIICLSWINDIYPLLVDAISARKRQNKKYQPNKKIYALLNTLDDIGTIRTFPENLTHPFDLNLFANELKKFMDNDVWKLTLKNNKAIFVAKNTKAKSSKYMMETYINQNGNACILKSNHMKVNLPFGCKSEQINYLILIFFQKCKINIDKNIDLKELFDLPTKEYKIYKYFNTSQ